MASSTRFVADAYASVDIATGVAVATPHQLTLILFDAALKHIGRASEHMKAGRIAEKGAAMTMAVRIVNEGLLGTLDLSQGELALNLQLLYEYIGRCLLKANLRNDATLLAEANALLTGMRDAWVAIAPSALRGQPPLRPQSGFLNLGNAAA